MYINPKNQSLVLDFDFTLCDSSVRENKHTRNDVLDLAAYRADTAQHDKALPLLQWILRNRTEVTNKYNVLILTNRDFFALCHSPIKDLVQNRFMCYHRGIYAPIYGDNFKAVLLHKMTMAQKAIVIDDEQTYLQIARDNNSRAICARELWHYNNEDFTRLFFGA